MQTVTECGQWRLRRRVLPQHTDHAGVMWHGAYLAWLEEARVEALAQVGLAYSALSARGIELPVVELTIQYLQPLRHGDAVEVRSRVLPRQGLKLCWLSDLRVVDGPLAAKARVELVLVKRGATEEAAATGGPVFRLQRSWPPDLAAAVAALEKGPG
jgi:acyl-CoA thioester hydrolase